MSALEAFLLGLVQGLTEFLPVSSSGHLVIGKALFGIELEDASFEIIVHIATALSIVVVFRRQIWEMIADTVRFRKTEATALTWRVLFSALPVLVVGLFFKDRIEIFFTTKGTAVVGVDVVVDCRFVGFGSLAFRKKAENGQDASH